MAAPKFSICIVTYKNIDNVRRCLDSVLRYSENYELILTDNGAPPSIGDLFESLAKDAPDRITVVHNPRNEGFIDPTRHALSIAKGAYFILLNDDATVPPNWLGLLEAPFLRDPRCALTAPNGGCCVIDWTMNGMPGLTPEYLEGACLMGQTRFLRKIGLWAKELEFAYWEDVDLSFRVREMGYHLCFANFQLQHIRGATSSKIPDILAYQRKNAGYIHTRWAHYLRHRTFEYPIIIRRRAAHGDVLLLTPIISDLNRLHPCSPIWVETECWEVLSNNPKVAKFFPRITDAQVPANAIVYDLNMAYEDRTMVHIVDAYADKCGLKNVPRITEMFPTASDLAWATRTLPGDDWIAIHPGPSTWKGKQWPMDRFAWVASELLERGLRVVLVGSADKTPIPSTIDLRGQTTVLQMAAVMRFCKLFVGLDSLPLHCAQAMGTPVVPLFGATLPEFILTDGSTARPVCGTTECAGERHRILGSTMTLCSGECMRSISTGMVMEKITELL